jgi:hypothetical protein
MQDDDYLKLLRKTIVADSDPQNVILLEIEPAKQKTRSISPALNRFWAFRQFP